MSKKKIRLEPESLMLPFGGVDSHAHLDLTENNDERESMISRASACGLSQIINVFLGPDNFEKNVSYFDNHMHVSFLLGVHPNDAETLTKDALDRMQQHFIENPRLKGVGEIGLDYYWDRVSRELQKSAFIQQLGLARELALPVVIHSRDANDDCISILEDQGFKDSPVLWHCFGSDLSMAERIVNNGWYISIPGTVTYRRTEALQTAVAQLPLDRLLIETDSPFLTPEPWRGKTNHPALIVFTAQKIAAIKERSVADIWQLTGENARRFFALERT